MDVVLPKENHTQFTEAATLDRKSGKAEGSAVRHSGAPHLPFCNHFPLCHLAGPGTPCSNLQFRGPFLGMFSKLTVLLGAS
jgi:hypothetical protein